MIQSLWSFKIRELTMKPKFDPYSNQEKIKTPGQEKIKTPGPICMSTHVVYNDSGEGIVALNLAHNSTNSGSQYPKFFQLQFDPQDLQEAKVETNYSSYEPYFSHYIPKSEITTQEIQEHFKDIIRILFQKISQFVDINKRVRFILAWDANFLYSDTDQFNAEIAKFFIQMLKEAEENKNTQAKSAGVIIRDEDPPLWDIEFYGFTGAENLVKSLNDKHIKFKAENSRYIRHAVCAGFHTQLMYGKAVKREKEYLLSNNPDKKIRIIPITPEDLYALGFPSKNDLPVYIQAFNSDKPAKIDEESRHIPAPKESGDQSVPSFTPSEEHKSTENPPGNTLNTRSQETTPQKDNVETVILTKPVHYCAASDIVKPDESSYQALFNPKLAIKKFSLESINDENEKNDLTYAFEKIPEENLAETTTILNNKFNRPNRLPSCIFELGNESTPPKLTFNFTKSAYNELNKQSPSIPPLSANLSSKVVKPTSKEFNHMINQRKTVSQPLEHYTLYSNNLGEGGSGLFNFKETSVNESFKPTDPNLLNLDFNA